MDFWKAVLQRAGLTTFCLAACAVTVAPAVAQRPPTGKHVRELARYLDGVKISEPITFRQLAVYPVLVNDVPLLKGRWLTLDSALSRGVIVVREKGAGSVPVVRVENRSRDEYVLLMQGEVIKGGMQTRTVRRDTALAPGEKVDLDVLCVEQHRWEGGKDFSAGKAMVPQSIQGELRKGAGQAEVWSGVARNNRALGAENATGSLERALKSRPVEDKLEEVRRKIVPEIPDGTTGFIFVSRGRAVGMDLFGSEHFARELLPKLLDSYAVDYVILRGADREHWGKGGDRAAIDFFERVCRTGSDRANTPGSGSGIRTDTGGLLGHGVSLDGVLVHYGVQVGERPVPLPQPHPRPPIIWPQPRHGGEPEERPPLVR
jgi:hypothetical protein